GEGLSGAGPTTGSLEHEVLARRKAGRDELEILRLPAGGRLTLAIRCGNLDLDPLPQFQGVGLTERDLDEQDAGIGRPAGVLGAGDEEAGDRGDDALLGRLGLQALDGRAGSVAAGHRGREILAAGIGRLRRLAREGRQEPAQPDPRLIETQTRLRLAQTRT